MTTTKPRQSWLKSLVAKYADGDLQAFAERVDIDRSTVSLLFHGHRPVTDKYAIRISNRLHVDPPADMKLQPVAPNATESTPATAHEAELVKMVERLLDQNDRLVSRLDTQGALLSALWDAVKGNSTALNEVREALARHNAGSP